MHLAGSYINPISAGSRGKYLIRVFISERENEDYDRPVVICSELEDNTGLSILHYASEIAGWFMRSHGISLHSTPVWIEHVPSSGEESEQLYLTTFDSYEVKETRAPYTGEAPVEIGAPPASSSTGRAYRRW